MYLPTVLLFL